MDGFKLPKPRRPIDEPRSLELQNLHEGGSPAPLPPIALETETPSAHGPRSDFGGRKKLILFGLLGIVLVVILAIGIWYSQSLKPANPNDQRTVDVTIVPNTSYGFVVQSLKSKGLIRSDVAATIYGYISGEKGRLKEGTCRVKPSQSTQDIVAQLAKGCDDFKSITFYPGATIEQPLYKPDHAELDQTLNIKNVLSRAGYGDDQISSALSEQYDSPLFEGKPSGSSLEGYVYGETYHVDPAASAEDVLKTSFAEMYSVVQKNNLIPAYKTKNLNLFQGITLASIVQRELNCEGKPLGQRMDRCYGYQRTIAQIFLKRLEMDMPLGSDVTFIYAADQMKVTPRVDLDSPYNTRKYPGLPPGPIASPGVHALRAVADPSPTDYLFFIAGDDGLIYFAKTDAEHQQNIKNHCQKLCNEL